MWDTVLAIYSKSKSCEFMYTTCFKRSWPGVNFINVLCALFLYVLLWVWLWTNFRTKNARVKCWWNWLMVVTILTSFYCVFFRRSPMQRRGPEQQAERADFLPHFRSALVQQWKVLYSAWSGNILNINDVNDKILHLHTILYHSFVHLRLGSPASNFCPCTCIKCLASNYCQLPKRSNFSMSNSKIFLYYPNHFLR